MLMLMLMLPKYNSRWLCLNVFFSFLGPAYSLYLRTLCVCVLLCVFVFFFPFSFWIFVSLSLIRYNFTIAIAASIFPLFVMCLCITNIVKTIASSICYSYSIVSVVFVCRVRIRIQNYIIPLLFIHLSRINCLLYYVLYVYIYNVIISPFQLSSYLDIRKTKKKTRKRVID